jgi:hypothetical protein
MLLISSSQEMMEVLQWHKMHCIVLAFAKITEKLQSHYYFDFSHSSYEYTGDMLHCFIRQESM